VAHVDDRWHKVVPGEGKVRTARYGKGKRWLARWVEDNGRERAKAFDRRSDADNHVATVEADKLRGTYIDPAAGRITFERYATDWLAAQTFDEKSREAVGRRLRLHAFPHLGDRDLGSVRSSHVQRMVGALSRDLAANHVRSVLTYVSAVFAAAVDDERIAKNPCRAASVKAPRGEAQRIVPWPAERVAAVQDALPPWAQVVVALAGGCGLRQSEVFGLAVEDVDFLRRFVHVRRQVKLVGGRYVFALPKGGKEREVPLPDSVALALSAHIAAFPPRAVALPWHRVDGDPVTARLLVPGVRHPHQTADEFRWVWGRALRQASVNQSRENGMHALRHWYASVLLDAGESIKALSEYLGHASAAFTLRTYTHLMPSSENRTRRAVDAAWTGGKAASADGPTTDQAAGE